MLAASSVARSNRLRETIRGFGQKLTALTASTALLGACGGKAHVSGQPGGSSPTAGHESSGGFNASGGSSAAPSDSGGVPGSDAGTGGQVESGGSSAGTAAGGSTGVPEQIKGCGDFGRIWNQPGCEGCIEHASTLCSPITEWLVSECSTSYGCADQNCMSCTGTGCNDMCDCVASCQVLGKDYCRDGWAEFMACFSDQCPASCR